MLRGFTDFDIKTAKSYVNIDANCHLKDSLEASYLFKNINTN